MSATGRKWQVLVVEDEALIVMSIEFAIEKLGADMMAVTARLDEALTMAARNDFDCAIVDVNIKGGPSYAVVEILIGNERPFVLASGYGDWSLPEEMRNHPRLIKPFSGRQLEARLCEMFAECARSADPGRRPGRPASEQGPRLP